MRRISRRYRIAFVAAMFLILAGWGFDRYAHYRWHQAYLDELQRVERNLRGKAEFSDPQRVAKELVGDEPPWGGFYGSDAELGARNGLAQFMEQHWLRSILIAIVFCVGLAYLAETLSRIIGVFSPQRDADRIPDSIQ